MGWKDDWWRRSVSARKEKRLRAKFGPRVEITTALQPVGVLSLPIKTIPQADRDLIDAALRRMGRL